MPIENIIAAYVPTISAVIGVLIMCATVLGKITATVNQARAAIRSVRSTDDFKMLSAELKRVIEDNEELRHLNRELIDQIAKIQGYSDKIPKGGSNK